MPVMDFKPRVKGEVERIEGSEGLSARDKELLLDYKRDMKIEGLSHSRIYKVLIHTRKLAEQLDGVSLDEASEEDIKDLMEWIRDRELAPATTSDYKGMIKRFYKWLNGGEYPDKVRWINTTRKRANGILPKNVLTEKDIRRLMDGARNSWDEALVALLWETGARIGELIDLEIGDLEDHDHGKKVVIRGKTGPRRVPLISSVPHLQVWINNHPKGNEKGAPLWVNIGTRNLGEKMQYRAITKALKEMGKRGDIDKPLNPHHFRHSQAAYLATRFTEAQMCEWFGWVQGSDMPAKYVHLSGWDIDADYARLHGIEDESRPEKSGMAPVDCPRCGAKLLVRGGEVVDVLEGGDE